MTNRLLEEICAQNGCVSFDGCSAADIATANAFLLNKGFCKIPEEYAFLLQKSDGLIFDGLELLGTQPHPRPQKNYVFKSLAEINSHYSKIDFFAQKLIIGCLSESFVVVDQANGTFAIVDRLNLDSKTTFSSFAELFKALFSSLAIKN